MQPSTLYIRNAGFGDMLQQINLFFHLSDAYSFAPKIFLDEKRGRNSLSNHAFLDEIGYTSLVGPRPEVSVEKAGSLSEISVQVSDAYKFDANCYHNPELQKATVGRHRNFHPRLRELAREGRLYAEICKRKDPTHHITLHARRGDVTQIMTSDFPKVFDAALGAGKILHCRGLFDKETLNDAIPKGNRRRFADAPTHLHALNLIKEREGVDGHLLVSDGFTRISKKVVNMHSDVLADKSMTVDALEKELEQELQPLMDRADQMIIGEQDALFFETIFTSLASKIIISQSPGFLSSLSKLFELDIKFVVPK
ncbi:hypothetical protein [Pseudophaeobacter sp.]|uniref:hypothetical protein n=1 Tax=Pseudophaeobacter sp. TaxID=1971739 RepID=UPI003296C374